MNFLSPGLLFGLLAASIPILIHLLNLRKLKKIDFSTLHFLRLIEKQKVRRVKLVQWLLMALRVLIIAMLVLGFSRPVIQNERIPGFTSAAKTTVVFVLDDSFSMEVVEGQGSRFNLAKGVVATILSGLKEGDEASVILTSGRDLDIRLTPGDLPALTKAIKDLEPDFISGDLNTAIIKASRLLGESENLNKELYILSDFQKATLGNPKEFTDVSTLLDSRVQTRLFNLGSKKTVNSAITGIKVNNQVFEPGKDISVTVTIRNYSDDDIKNGVVSLFVNDERGAQKSYNLDAGKITDITLSAPVRKSGFSSIYASIEDDDMKTDNRRYASIFLPKEFSTVLLGKSSDLKFIRAAIEAGSFSGNMKITEKDITQTGALDLKDVNMIIVAGSGEGVNLGKLRDYTANGGGILLFPGENTSLAGYSALLKQFGVSPPLELKKDSKALPGKFSAVMFNHPLLREIFQTQYGNSVESPELVTWFRLPQGGGTDIITMADGSVFLKETRAGKGRVLSVATSPTLSTGDFPMIPLFAPLVYRSMFYLASQEPATGGSLTGEEIALPGRKTGGGKVTVVAPNGLASALGSGKTDDGVVFPGTDLPGIYRFTRDDEEIDFVPVNTDTTESNSTPMERQEIVDYFKKINVKNSPVFIGAEGNFTQTLTESRLGSELWKLFIIIAMILIGVEMYFSRAKKSDTP